MFLDLAGIVLYTCLLNWRFIIHEQLNYFLGDMFAITCLFSSLVMIRKKKPLAAGNFAMIVLASALFYYTLGDYLIPMGKDMTRLYESLIMIIVDFYLASLVAIRSRQLVILICLSFCVISSHFAVLFFLSYGGEFSFTTLYPHLYSLALVVGCGYVSLKVMSLTAHKRGDIFTNIVFYKLGQTGPECFFIDHPLERGLQASMGGYLYSAIGQGQQYHLGLFGPVPWGDKEAKQVAYIYSALLSDSGVPDIRLNGRNYLLIALILRQDMVHLVERNDLQIDLETSIRLISDLSNLAESQIREIVQVIHGVPLLNNHGGRHERGEK